MSADATKPAAEGVEINDLHDALSERLAQASGVMHTLTADEQFKVVSEDVLAGTLWCVTRLVEEAREIHRKMCAAE